MLEVMQFIFSSFWVWSGTTIMLGVVATAFGAVIGAIVSPASGSLNKNENDK